MKKLLLTVSIALTILFAQAQCQANFSYIQNGSTIVFSDLSTMQSTNYSVTWQWDFGDGNTSTQQNPTHSYSTIFNQIYTPCLTVTFFDSIIFNYCTSIYYDSILIGNSIPASWDCNPITGCFDPGTGLGQYSSFASCDTMCGTPTPSWDCDPNTALGCYDPGTGNGQYTTLAACQAVCGMPTPSWDCGPQGCYDPNTGMGQYTSLAACQSICQLQTVSPCDSIDIVGSQSQLTMQVMSGTNVNSPLYIVTTDPNGYIVGEDSLTWTHDAWPIMALTDSIITCITYVNGVDTLTCCVEFFWNGSFWAKIGSITLVGEIGSFDKKLIKVVNVLGRKSKGLRNQPLFYIYDDGTVEKRITIE